MKLVKFDNYKINITEEALLVKAFRCLWARDKSEDKSKALQEFGVMYFLLDPRSDYMYIIDEDERLKEILKQEGMPADWKPDKEVKAAMEVYKSLTQTTASLALEDSKICLEKIRKFIREYDLSSSDDPVKAAKDLTSTAKLIPGYIKEITEMEDIVNKELNEGGRVRGQAIKTIMEDSVLLD